jgi:CDP-4-dehydro-6-deoxyglucose reductase, E3
MYQITLKNGVKFQCDSSTTIFEAAKNSGIILEHSCLKARCRSCAVQIETGETKNKLDDLVLSDEEKAENWILSCNAVPISDLLLDSQDLTGIQIFQKKIIPAKINSIEKINNSVMEVGLRLPPNSNFSYNSGQYVNISKGQIIRSYSIANANNENGIISFLIKKYERGLMSNYWFNEAQVNDLLRIEGPLGSFFLRETNIENIIFLATGTGIAPIKAILEDISISKKQFLNKNLWLFVGARFDVDLLWSPNQLNEILNINYIPVLSKGSKDWYGERGYVQDVVVKQNISLANSHVYACGSSSMIESAKMILVENGLNKNHFFSDVFVPTS